MRDLSAAEVGSALGAIGLVSAVVIGTRFGWSYTMPYVIRTLDRRPLQRLRRVGAAGGPRRSTRALRLELIAHKRATTVRLRDQRAIDDTVLRLIQSRLDVEEVRLSPREPAE